jgi:RimJ/RimL family protein N-acetyltransferase
VPTAWPLFDLVVATPRLTLRLPREDELLGLAGRAAGRVLPEHEAGFMGAWTQLPSPEFERAFMQFHWRMRASWTPQSWGLDLGVYPRDGDEPVGIMGAQASAFAQTRSVTTGSWLLPEWRGRGLGRESRAAILHLLFDGLGAREARSAAHPDNAASNAVSSSLGYRADGTDTLVAGGGEAVTVTRLVLRRDKWLAQRRGDIELSGLETCAAMFGA